MWNNIGKKIKTLAKVIFWIEAAIAILGVTIAVFTVNWQAMDTGVSIGTLLGLVFGLGLAILFFWLGSFLLCGLGQLIESSEETATLTRRIVAQNDELLRMNDATAAAACQIQRSMQQTSQDDQQREFHQ